MSDAPVTVHLSADDLAYIVDALIDASERRRARTGRIHELIAEDMEGLALTLYDARPSQFTTGAQR